MENPVSRNCNWLQCLPRPVLASRSVPPRRLAINVRRCYRFFMRTAGIIAVTIAALGLAVVLIAPGVALDDYGARPWDTVVATLLWLFLLTTSVCGCLHLAPICPDHARRETWPRSTLVVTAPPVLIC
jgi:succinate dehydrogenase hydrophobic anchor subunit